MNRIHTTRLNLTWSTSRGRDTYGYNIARLDDSSTGKRYRTSGGGYDMVGTVFAAWMQDTHQDALQALEAAHAPALVDCGYSTKGYRRIPAFYGLTFNPDGSVHLDGACGLESMVTIAAALGLTVQRTYSRGRNGKLDGFIVSHPYTQAEEAAHVAALA